MVQFVLPFTKEFDDDLGLVYMYQRWYSPELGIFMSSAPYPPMVEHRYSFALQQPNRYIDPRGEKMWIGYTYSWWMPFNLLGMHMYMWDDRTNIRYDRTGSSGLGKTETPGFDPTKTPTPFGIFPIPGSEGNEDEIINSFKSNAIDGLFVPFANDCHNSVKDAVEAGGGVYPNTGVHRFSNWMGVTPAQWAGMERTDAASVPSVTGTFGHPDNRIQVFIPWPF